MKKKVLTGTIVNLILVIGLIVLLILDRTTLIISMGVTAANLIKQGGTAALIVLLVLHNTLWVIGLLKKEKQRLPDISLTVSSDTSYDSEQLRKELHRFARERTGLKQELTEALEQMDSMDRKQEKLLSIFKRNKEESLGEVEATIEIAEQSMFRNIARMINRAILWDPLEANKAGKEKVYQEHQKHIRYLLNQNEEMLSKCDFLLSETVSYIGDKKGGGKSGELHLDAMMEAIRSLNKIREIELGEEKS